MLAPDLSDGNSDSQQAETIKVGQGEEKAEVVLLS